MDENSSDRIDDVIMPGFRFHPTDEELVGFYLKRKIQQRLLPIELIKQVDIYKYDPWDLPKLASSGEKEWYFYCPRDRKYRNSARPNRVTGAGFWKATGTDRPIYSSDGTKCIGLKKSLVFYRGRAAKGIKTDWMMHEFRLPSTATNNNNDAASTPSKKFSDKSLPLHDAWAICRIFKKTNSLAQRALSHSWIASLPETPSPDMFPQYTHYSSENISCTTETGSAFSSLNIPSSKPPNGQFFKQDFSQNGDDINVPTNFIFSQPDKCSMDVASMLFNSIDSEGSQQQHFNGFSIGSSSSPEMHDDRKDDSQWGYVRSMGFPFNLPNNLPWDSPDCPSSEVSTATYSNKCYT